MTCHWPPQPDIVDLTVFLLHTGARLGEALSLRWADVDRVNGLICLTATKRARGGATAPVRHVPIHPAVRVLLDRLKGQDSPFAHVRRSNLERRWRQAVTVAGIGQTRIHDLRHTFASHLAMAGTPLPVLSGLLGHASIEMTMRYSHLCPDVTRQSVSALTYSAADLLQKDKKAL